MFYVFNLVMFLIDYIIKTIKQNQHYKIFLNSVTKCVKKYITQHIIVPS